MEVVLEGGEAMPLAAEGRGYFSGVVRMGAGTRYRFRIDGRLLKGPAAPLNSDPRLRQAELRDHLKEGTLIAHCEVVRDLAATGWHKPLSGAMAAFLKSTQDVLCQEWAAVEGVSLAEAESEIAALLDQGRQANDKE